MAGFKLASAGDDIKVWDCDGYSLLKQYNPHASQEVSAIAWSQDNNFVASTSAGGDKVSVTCIKNSAYTSTELAAGEDRTCVAFNSNSRYLLCGGKSGTLAIWDLKTQKTKKQYKDHTSAITSLSFNWNDTYIASGAANGDIILYNVVTAHGSQPMTSTDTQAIRQLQYSHFRKALLGAASDDGVVNLWDTNTRRLLHSFSEMHCASVTGLSFSPLNEMLMMSVGLDKRIVCYDVMGKTAVKTMTADAPLTSIDIHPDGATLAIGSARGKIYVYDLRYGAQPMQTLTAHKSTVQMVKFMNILKIAKDDNATKSKSTRLNQIRKLHSTNTSPKLIKGDAELATHTKPQGLTDRTNLEYSIDNRIGDVSKDKSLNNNQSTTSYESEIISPYKDVTLSKGGNEISSENKPDVSDASVADMGVFSPLAANGSISNASYQSYNDSRSHSSIASHQSPQLVSRNQSQTGTLPTPTNEEQGRVQAPLSDPGNSSSSDSHSSIDNTHVAGIKNAISNQMVERLKNDLRSTSPVNISTEMAGGSPLLQSPRTTIRATKNVQKKLISQEAGITDWRTVTDKSATGVERERSRSDSDPCVVNRSFKTPSKHIQHELEPLTDSTAPSGGQCSSTSTGGVPIASAAQSARTFQMDVIKNTIQDCMEEFQDEMRKDMMKLHVEMLRQFQIQQAELLSMVRQHSINDELLLEIERLREENRRLKKTF